MIDSIKYGDYYILITRAMDHPSERNISALALWFELYGMDFWNGEYWDADGYKLIPVFEYDPVTDQQNTIAYKWEVGG